MAHSLSRNAKVILSEKETGNTASNTFEIRVLDGFSFSQATGTQNVTLNQAGGTNTRGQRVFNTTLEPVDWSFSTYIRPYTKASGATHTCIEELLWDALSSSDATDATGIANSTTNMIVDFDDSESSAQLKTLFMWVSFEDSDITYKISGMVVNSASIDFDIDNIAQISWSGSASTVAEGSVPTAYSSVSLVDDADFILNRMSTLELSSDLDGTGKHVISTTVTGGSSFGTTVPTVTFVAAPTGGRTATGVAVLTGGAVSSITITDAGAGYTTAPSVTIAGIGTGASATSTLSTATAQINYTFPLTGGNVTFDNGISYVTPEELGVINKPFEHIAGTRVISGSINAYLDTSSTGTRQLYNDLLTDINSSAPEITNAFNTKINIGGSTNGTPRIYVLMPKASLELPTLETADVMGVSVNFTALEAALGDKDEATIEYYGVTST